MASNVTIGNLIALSTVSDTTVFAASDSSNTRKVSALVLKNYMSTLTTINTSGVIYANGGLVANTLQANTLQANTIQANTIQANTIQANTIQANIIGNVGAVLIGTLATAYQANITSIGALGNLTVVGNAAIGSNLSIGGNLVVSGAINNTLIGNVTPAAGTFTTLAATTMNTTSGIFWTSNGQPYSTASGVNFGSIGANIIPSANLTYNIGSSTAWWNNIYGTAVHAQYADLAEIYQADAEYPAGTVVIFGGPCEITTSAVSHTPFVAGVISTNPAYLMNSASTGLPVALKGRVPCRVQGPVSKGDRLVNLDSGIAGKLVAGLYQPGCVIGHALEDLTTSTVAVIEIAIMKF